MKKINVLILLLVVLFNFFNAQTITFISEKTNKPLPKVSVFGNDGSILAYSDIDGKIDKESLNPSQEKFQLVYDNFLLATLSYAEINKDVVKLSDRIKEIEPVTIKNNKPAKYIFVKGNFNTYVTINNKLNCYADGIITYIFDNKTKKLKSTNVEQYRIYRLEDTKNEKKEAGSWDYNSFLELPELKHIGKPEDYKTRITEIKELKGDRKDEIEISGGILQEKEFAFLGYRFYDLKTILNISFEKDSKKTFKDFLEYNEISFIKLKHKSEPNYNQVITYNNFYPTEFSFSNEKDVEEVRFSPNYSNYTTNFWREPSFPNMQSIFSSFFKDDLKEQQKKK